MTTLTLPGDIPAEDRHWPEPVPPWPSPAGAALELLEASIEQGATVVAIGPYTNLALLETARLGRLVEVPVVLMGGWVAPPAEGLPPWGPEVDWNVQCDTRAAEIVASGAGQLTLITLAATAAVHLCGSHLGGLEASGPLGRLLARQADAHGADHHMGDLGRRHERLPDDLLNFQHDPLAGAVAVGWDQVATEQLLLSPVYNGGVLRFQPGPAGRSAGGARRGTTGTALPARRGESPSMSPGVWFGPETVVAQLARDPRLRRGSHARAR